MAASSKSHDRAAGQTSLNISMPESLKEQIRLAAAKEHRTMSGYIVHHLSLFVSDDSVAEQETARQKIVRDHSLASVVIAGSA
jgi:hypothetical protein